MGPIYQLPEFRRDDGNYTNAQLLELLKRAAAQGFPTGPDSYLSKMTIPQIKALLDGKTDA